MLNENEFAKLRALPLVNKTKTRNSSFRFV